MNATMYAVTTSRMVKHRQRPGVICDYSPRRSSIERTDGSLSSFWMRGS